MSKFGSTTLRSTSDYDFRSYDYMTLLILSLFRNYDYLVEGVFKTIVIDSEHESS